MLGSTVLSNFLDAHKGVLTRIFSFHLQGDDWILYTLFDKEKRDLVRVDLLSGLEGGIRVELYPDIPKVTEPLMQLMESGFFEGF